MAYIPFGTFRASYVQIEEPTQYKGKGDAKYRIALIFSKDDTKLVGSLKDAIDEAARSEFKGKKYESPIHDGDERDGEEFANCFYLNASNKFPINVVDAQKNPLDPKDIYSGCYVNATLQFYPYKSSKNGVGVSISALQKVRDGKHLGGGNPDTTDAFSKLDVEVDELDDDLFD